LNCSPHPGTAALKPFCLAHGVTVKLLVGLIKARLATVQSERVVGGGRSIEVARVRITDAGRRELAGQVKL
jgi:hypothetical protein